MPRYQSTNCTFVLLYRGEGETCETLLQLRQNTGYMDGYYDLAASGHLEPGESLLDCAIRETKEETGITLYPENVKLVFINHQYEENYVRMVFAAELPRGSSPKIREPDRNGGFLWAKPDQLPDNVRPFIPKMFEAMKAGLNYDDQNFTNLARNGLYLNKT